MTHTAWSPSHPVARPAAPSAPVERGADRPRPDLPSWFGGATTALYAGCAVTAAGAFLLVPFAALLLPVLEPATTDAMIRVGMWLHLLLVVAVALGVGGWCVTAARSRHVDPTTPHLDPVWFMAAWFVPVVNVFVPYRMFGDLWASAKWHHSDRRHPHTPLAARPWVMTLWAVAWGLDLLCVVLVMLDVIIPTPDFGPDPVLGLFVLLHLVLLTAAMGLLGGVVRAIARELDAPLPRP